MHGDNAALIGLLEWELREMVEAEIPGTSASLVLTKKLLEVRR